MATKKKPSSVEVPKAVLVGWLLGGVVAALIAALLIQWDAAHPPAPVPTRITVYNSENCECCWKWVAHLRDNGFDVHVEEHPGELRSTNALMGIPKPLAACHTALVSTYVLTGHVPAGDIKRLLAERPEARGLAVPGMPIGSPGMEQGNRRESYDVLLFRSDGQTQVWSAYDANTPDAQRLN